MPVTQCPLLCWNKSIRGCVNIKTMYFCSQQQLWIVPARPSLCLLKYLTKSGSLDSLDQENLSFSLGRCQDLALTVEYKVSGRFPPGSQTLQIWYNFSKLYCVKVVGLVNNVDKNVGTTPYTHADPHAKDTRNVWDHLYRLPVQLTSQCCLHEHGQWDLNQLLFMQTCSAHHHLSLKPSQVSLVISPSWCWEKPQQLRLSHCWRYTMQLHGKKMCNQCFALLQVTLTHTTHNMCSHTFPMIILNGTSDQLEMILVCPMCWVDT